jgi:branched-chain amino acid aminotransferase
MKKNYCYLNGEILETAQAQIGVMDLGFLRGYGIFDFLQVRSGVPLFIDDYLARFQRSAKLMDLQIPISIQDLKETIHKIITLNDLEISGLRMVLTGGYSDDYFTPAPISNFLIVESAMTLPSPTLFEQGVKLATLAHERELPEVKSTNYLSAIRFQPKWKAMNAYDVLYTDRDGNATESSRSNFFIVTHDDVIVTPTDAVLHGITRNKVLDVAATLGLKVELRAITPADLATCREAFITSSTKGVLPIVEIDDFVISARQIGKISQLLMDGFIAMQNAYLQNAAVEMV